jgi:nucleotide-binding universal stress UspA family protein
MLLFKKLLVSTDFSEPSYRGVKAADELARKFDAELLVVHVVAVNQFAPLPGPPVPSDQQAPSISELIEAARLSINQTIEARVSQGVLSRTFILSGPPGEEIVRTAEEEKVDAIVIATHGWTGWRRFIFGSVAERVVRLAQCPVLTVPGGGDKE